MNTQQIQCFLYVADRLNFTKAAEELYLSVPTVTHHIKTLEEELHTKLFFRTSRIVQLTEAGNIFYKDAKEIYDKIMLSQKHIQQISEQNITYLKIGCSSNWELEGLTDVLSKMHLEFPSVYCQVFIHDHFSLRHLFENHQLDLILSPEETTKNISGYHFKKLKDFRNYIVAVAGHSIFEQPEISLDMLTPYNLITLHPRFIPFHAGNVLQEYIALHAQDHADIFCENSNINILMARCGYGVAILPEFYVPRNLEGLQAAPITASDIMSYGISYYEKETYIQYFLKNYNSSENPV